MSRITVYVRADQMVPYNSRQPEPIVDILPEIDSINEYRSFRRDIPGPSSTLIPPYRRGPGSRGPSYRRFSSDAPMSSTIVRPYVPAMEIKPQGRRGPPSAYDVPPVWGTENLASSTFCPYCNLRYSSRNCHQCPRRC